MVHVEIVHWETLDVLDHGEGQESLVWRGATGRYLSWTHGRRGLSALEGMEAERRRHDSCGLGGTCPSRL